MKAKLSLVALALTAMVLAVGSVSAWNFSINGTNVVVDPARGACDLYSFSTTYHYDNNISARNQAYPGYEYQYEGEWVDFWATIQDFSQWNVMNAFPQVVFTPGIVGAPVNLSRTSEPTFVNGKYQAQFHGRFRIPTAIQASGNYRLSLVVFADNTTQVRSCENDLLNGMYRNVNDVLVNPAMTFAGTGFTFSPSVYNAYNPAAPLYNDYYLRSSATDREGDGVIGDLEVEMPRFRGRCTVASPTCIGGLIVTNGTGDVIPASNVRFHKDTDPSGVYTQLTDRVNMTSAWAPVAKNLKTESATGPEQMGTSQHVRLFWELYYSQLFNAPAGYVSDVSAFNGGNIMFTYRIV